jgi:hypothetical protein
MCATPAPISTIVIAAILIVPSRSVALKAQTERDNRNRLGTFAGGIRRGYNPSSRILKRICPLFLTQPGFFEPGRAVTGTRSTG